MSMKKIFGPITNPSETTTFTTGSGIEVQTNGDCVWIKVGNMTIYAEANCPTRDDKVGEFISIHKKDSSEKTSLLMYGDEVVSINDRAYNDFYGKVLTQQEEEWLETHGAIHPREIAGYADDLEPGEYQ